MFSIVVLHFRKALPTYNNHYMENHHSLIVVLISLKNLNNVVTRDITGKSKPV